MSNLSDQFESAAAQLSDELGDTVVVSSSGAEPVSVTAIIGHEEVRNSVEQDGLKSRYVRTLSLPCSAAAAGGGPFVPSVNLHDQFTLCGNLYSVETIVSVSANWIRLEIYRMATREKTRQGYRRKT